ncbi:MAG: hypothetical protein EP319_13195 [Deltaproteobacteria bacterium]|nr:MAG: hypothetical protein EP319_13195 [Deltaproteobacteria bacterium]
MKQTLSVLILIALSGQVMAQEALTSVSEEKSETKRSTNKRYLGFSIGNHLGEIGVGFKYGQFLTENNLAELTYTQWTEAESGTILNAPGTIKSDGRGISLSNRYFLGNSFNIGSGLYYRDVDLTLPANVKIMDGNKEITERKISDFGGVITLGNHWFGDRWTFNADWVSYIPKFARINDVPGLSYRGEVTILNFTVGLTF